MVSRLEAPLAGVRRVDALQSLDLGDGRIERWRAGGRALRPGGGRGAHSPSAAALRKLPAHTLRVQLLAVDEAGERPLGEYTFAHTPS